MHTLEVVANPFGASGIAPMEWLFNRGPVELGGGKGIVNAVGWDASVTCEGEEADEPECADAPTVQPAYHVNWIPSFRSVIDFADFDAVDLGPPHRCQRAHLPPALRRPARAVGGGPDPALARSRRRRSRPRLRTPSR